MYLIINVLILGIQNLTPNKTARQVNTFLIDLQDYIKSDSSSRYYFGHFLFEEKSETCFGIIDGQQRLTTITIFIAALFNRLKELRILTDEEDFAYKSMIKVGQVYHFRQLIMTINYLRITSSIRLKPTIMVWILNQNKEL